MEFKSKPRYCLLGRGQKWCVSLGTSRLVGMELVCEPRYCSLSRDRIDIAHTVGMGLVLEPRYCLLRRDVVGS